MIRTFPFEDRRHKEVSPSNPYKAKQTLQRLNFETLYVFKVIDLVYPSGGCTMGVFLQVGKAM